MGCDRRSNAARRTPRQKTLEPEAHAAGNLQSSEVHLDRLSVDLKRDHAAHVACQQTHADTLHRGESAKALGDGTTEIEATIPLASMQRYAADLRSITQAQAVFSATLSEYAVVPHMEAEKVIDQYKGTDEEE